MRTKKEWERDMVRCALANCIQFSGDPFVRSDDAKIRLAEWVMQSIAAGHRAVDGYTRARVGGFEEGGGKTMVFAFANIDWHHFGSAYELTRPPLFGGDGCLL